MAAKTFYLIDALASGSNHLSLQDGGSPPTQAAITTGWVAATLAPTRYARMDSQTERASGALLTTPVEPNSDPDNTLGDCFRSQNTLTGTFANANWSISMQVRGITRTTSTTDGRWRIRIWKSTDATGASPTELTGATLTTTQFTDLSNSVYQTLTATFSPGAEFTFTNEYLFIQVAFQLDGAGNNANADVHVCVGSSNSIITSDFVSVKAFTATSSPVTTTPTASVLAVSRPMVGAAVGASVTPTNVNLQIVVLFQALSQIASATPDVPILAVSRSMVGQAAGLSSSPDDADILISREIVAAAVFNTATPDISVLAIQRQLSALANGITNTPDTGILAVVRAVVALAGIVSATPDNVNLPVNRSMAAMAGISISTPDNPVLSVLRALEAAVVGSSNTPVAALLVSRALIALSNLVSTTPDDVDLNIEGVITMSALADIQSATPAPILAVSRAMVGLSQFVSNSPDDVDLNVGGLVLMSALASIQSVTPNPNLAVSRSLIGLSQIASQTPDVVHLLIVAVLSGTIGIISVTPDTVNLHIPGAGGVIELAFARGYRKNVWKKMRKE